MPVELPTSNIYREEGETSFELYVNGFKKSGPPPTHLVFLIHGIGYKMFEKTKFQENMFAMSTTAQEVLFSKFSDSKMRIFYLPITWAEELHALTTVDGRMSKITLPTIPGMRVITNDCLSDVLYYFTDFHRQQLLNIICEKMNVAYGEFVEVYPEFDGHAGILSHSLGGVISYDLLTNKEQTEEAMKDELYSVAFPRTNYPELKFKPSFLFALGSPIGAVMVMRGLRHEHFCLPEHVKFMNIFNPYDPLAYRIEPLIGEQYDTMDPVPIPTCEIKDNTSYLPNFTSLMPDRPNILRAAQSMLAKINLMEEPQDEIESSDSDLSCQECIVDLKQEDEDDASTRRVSGLNVSAIGLSSFKRGSVVERLHELKNSSSSRPSSFYQAAVSTLYSPRPGKSDSRPRRTLPRRSSFPVLSSRKPKSRLKPFSKLKVECSGNESDDEASPGDLMEAATPWSPFDLPPAPPTPRPSQHLVRSKTWDNMDLKEEEMMWLWGGMGYGLQEDSMDVDGSPKPPPEEIEPRPKLITNLTSNLRRFVSRDTMLATPESSSHDVPMLSPNGSVVSVPITCQSIGGEVEETIQKEKELRDHSAADAVYPTASENELPRFDYCTQTKVISNLSFEYLVGLGAHFSYWCNRDVANIVLETLNQLPRSQKAEAKPTHHSRSASAQTPNNFKIKLPRTSTLPRSFPTTPSSLSKQNGALTP